MMGSVQDDYLEEDQPVEEVLRDWQSGERVVVIPSSLHRQLRRQRSRLRHFLATKLQKVAEELQRAADRLNSPPRPHGSRARSRGPLHR
jgi:prephenate dehydrogenase